jgi:hypothetical protein
MSSKSKSDDFPMTVVFEDDGSITFDWDPRHPVTSIFNDWTASDFEKMLVDACNSALEKCKDG